MEAEAQMSESKEIENVASSDGENVSLEDDVDSFGGATNQHASAVPRYSLDNGHQVAAAHYVEPPDNAATTRSMPPKFFSTPFPSGDADYSSSAASGSNVIPMPTTNIPLSSPGASSPSRPVSDGGISYVHSPSPINNKLESVQDWSVTTAKITKQWILERLGRVSKTVDIQLDDQIASLRDTQRRYQQILQVVRAMASHFGHVLGTQKQLGDIFSDMSQKALELQQEFAYNAETQKALFKNGETLVGAMDFFISSVNTLCTKTIEDTILTVRQYEKSRIEYDAYRCDWEKVKSLPKSPANDETFKKFNDQREKFERLRTDVSVKIQFLEENKVKVMHKQLLLFHNAISAYFSGNQVALEAAVKMFNVNFKSPNSTKPSWIEQ